MSLSLKNTMMTQFNKLYAKNMPNDGVHSRNQFEVSLNGTSTRVQV
jgi:hypothetical protein